MQEVLVVEDDLQLTELLAGYLTKNGFKIMTTPSGQEGIELHRSRQFSAIILDLMLPDIDGLEVCRQLRNHSNVPLLMLTAKGDPMDRVLGLELGADDYLTKPFEPREMLARLRAILRRGISFHKQNVTRFGKLEIDHAAMEARVDGLRCSLTAHQFQILSTLAQNAGRVLSRDYVMNQLRGMSIDTFDRSIDVHISRIRSAIEDDPRKPRRIITVRGAGYVFARTQD